MYTTLRLIHIIAGIFVGGTYLFLVPILEPRLKRLGPAIQGPVIRAIMPVLTPVMGLSFIVLFGTGTAMTLLIRQGNLSQLVTTAWGWDILIGIIATIVICIVGFGISHRQGFVWKNWVVVSKGVPPVLKRDSDFINSRYESRNSAVSILSSLLLR